MMTGPRHCRDPNRDRVQHEPEDEKLRQQNRERIQDNLHLPGFTLPKDVFGINHKHWWKPLVANPHSVGYGYGIFHLKKASRVEVAERLSEVYEAALAELRFKVLSAMSPANRLVTIDKDWAPLREDKRKRDLTYGMNKYDEARRKYLPRPTPLESLGDDAPTFTRLWFLVDRWLELTTDGNTVLNLDNGTSALIAGLDPVPLPMTTSKFAKCIGPRDQQNVKASTNSSIFDFASIYDSLRTDIEDMLARENTQLAQRIKQLEDENSVMLPELKRLRATLASTRQSRLDKWSWKLQSYNEKQRKEGKPYFGSREMFGFLQFVEQQEAKERI
ncbi:hypothetical protein CGCF415_v014334 [Colletotrichum fructicola]|uniref:Uncharacterized protein n=1 Tax=Colletotrichum fructicola (strain Nara gc5) TaxID=1213859 RepID=A0A7J6IH21_COLFN|nr:hypothetical protein CGGC5_v014944 [Colletotrichum fructicola Nara gc5]KAF4881385.1 hypothetical protein CGCFRS4_v015610 [Colletotrichum fructicola]KAF4888808.1 hypothetical protein CGCF415_v014334 [Colletotrichum fructicola]KAF4922147.1 hypothetical protein CGCF245_v015417 [Colletotrichum fructicola]